MECHECGATISDKAADCPRCGASVRDLSGGAEAETPEDAAHAGDAQRETDAASTNPETEAGSDERGVAVESDDTASDGSAGEAVSSDDGRDDPVVPGAESDHDTTEAEGSESPTDTEGAETTIGSRSDETETGWEAADSPPNEQGSDRDVTGSSADGEETGWEAAGPPPEDQETGAGSGAAVGGGESVVDDQETAIGGESTVGGDEQTAGGNEPVAGGGSEFGGGETSVDADAGFGRETGTGGADPEVPDRTGETGEAGAAVGRESDSESAETVDLSEGVGDLPFLSGPIAGLVTASVLAVVSVVVAALDPSSTFDTVSQGAVVLLDLHFAAGFTVEPDLLVAFGIADPDLTPVDLLTSSVGILYLLPVIFCYTAAKFLTAYNVDETTPLPLAGATGALIAVGYFPVMLVALVLAPSGAAADVSLPRAVLLGGLAYPLVFGSLGGLAAGAFSASERRVGTLYGVVAFFLMTIGAFAVTIPALTDSDLGLLPQVHASLFTIVSVNGFGLPNPGMSGLVSLGYPLVGGIVFAAGFLRAWNASDVEEPLRGAAKGLSPVATYFVLLGVVATLLPLLADGDVAAGLGLDSAGVTLVRELVRNDLTTIDQYVFAVFVGTLVYAVFLGGLGGTVAGAARYALSEDN